MFVACRFGAVLEEYQLHDALHAVFESKELTKLH